MPARKKSVFKDPKVIVALISLVGTIIGTVAAPLIIAYVNREPSEKQAEPTRPNDEAGADKLWDEAQSWELVFRDTFDTDRHGWHVGTRSNSGWDEDMQIRDGKYVWDLTAKDENLIRWTRPASVDPLENFFVSVEARNLNDLKYVKYGLTFHDQGTGVFYDFELFMEGKFAMRYYNDDAEKSSNYLTSLATTTFTPGEETLLGVVGLEGNYWLFINEHPVAQVKDYTLPMGGVGLLVSVKDSGDQAQVAFDNFTLRRAP